MKNSDNPAHPKPHGVNFETATVNGWSGLTKREIFAMHAMQGLLANSYGDSWSPEQRVLSISRQSVEHAGALLKELEK
jgi:hypothetical protein